MLEQRIEQHFIDSADLKYQTAQILSKPIAAAVQALLVCVTSGAARAPHFAASFVGRFERERPELAALALAADSAVLTGAANEQGFAGMFGRQVRALGGPGDVLLVMSVDGNCSNLQQAIAAAHEREMVVIGLSGHGGGAMVQIMRDTDIHVDVPHERTARILEILLLVLHCLCDAVDAQLLGEHEEPR